MTVPPVPGWAPAALAVSVGVCAVAGVPKAGQVLTGPEPSAGRQRPDSAREWLLAAVGVPLAGGLLARAALHSVLVVSLTDAQPDRVATTPRRGLQTPAPISGRDRAGIQFVSGLLATSLIALIATGGYRVSVAVAWPVIIATILPLVADIPLGAYHTLTTNTTENT